MLLIFFEFLFNQLPSRQHFVRILCNSVCSRSPYFPYDPNWLFYVLVFDLREPGVNVASMT